MAICNYTRHTNLTIEPRTRDLGALIFTVCLIEGPRVMRVQTRRARQTNEAKVAKAAEAMGMGGTIINMDPTRPRAQ